MSRESQPKVSIGLPVHNGGDKVHHAINDLLAQDYTNFELIISDNASTDDTWQVCQAYAARDSRIRVVRNETNGGAIFNFNRVFALSSGKYFMWAAHDDHWEPAYIRTCVERLEAEPAAALCYCRYLSYRSAEAKLERTNIDLRGMDHPEAWQRLHTLLNSSPFPFPAIYGLFRRDMLRQVMPVLPTYGSDGLLLLDVAAIGSFIEVDEPLFTYAWNPSTLKSRARSFNQAPNMLTLLIWDFRLFWIPLMLSWRLAADWRARFKLVKAVMRFGIRCTGWPNPRKVVYRYGFIMLPDGISKRLLAVYRRLKKPAARAL